MCPAMRSARSPQPDLFERAGREFWPTERALGPWSDGRLHGGAVAGLLAELAVSSAAEDQIVAAYRSELFGPVPRERLHAELTCARAGSRLAIWNVELRAGERTHARATVTLVAPRDGGPAATRSTAYAGPGSGRTPPERVTTSSPFFGGIEFRVIRGDIGAAGPTAVWTKVEHRWFDGRPPSGLARLVAAADTAYGYGLPVAGDAWLAMNLDLTVQLLREPEGAWLLLDTTTDLGTNGLGVGHAEVADATGLLGRVSQSVVVRAARR